MLDKKWFSIFLLVATAAFPAFAIEPRPSCEALQTWASQLEKLPADYDSFTALPPDYRHAAYQKLSAEQQAGLWHHQWQKALGSDEFDAKQKALIAETDRLVTTEFRALLVSEDGATAAAAKRELQALRARVLQEFPRESGLWIFYQLGRRSGSEELSAIRICDCLTSDHFCGGWGDCYYLNPCAQNPNGCGFSGGELCDGRCG